MRLVLIFALLTVSFASRDAVAGPLFDGARLLDTGGGDSVASDGLWKKEFAFAAGGAAVAVPLSFFAARAIGRFPKDIVAAAAPTILVYLLVPPLAAALAGAWGAGDGSGRRWWPAFLLSTGAQLLTIGAGVLLGVSLSSPLALVLFFVGDVAVLAGAATLGLELFPAPTGSGGGLAARPVERVGVAERPGFTALSAAF